MSAEAQKDILYENLKGWKCIEIIRLKNKTNEVGDIICKINGRRVDDLRVSEFIRVIFDIIAPSTESAEELEMFEILYEVNGAPVDHLKLSEIIEIIRASKEDLTITLAKKPRAVVETVEAVVQETTEATPSQDEEPKKEKRSSLKPTSLKKPQEVESMYAKLDRLKPRPTQTSQFPNARIVSFNKTGSVGIQVAGGNELGIFVAAVRKDSAAAREGLKPGDQILMCNDIDFEDTTREEAVLILLALPDDVSLVVESKKDEFDEIKRELGDNFYIRVNFHHTVRTISNELTFRKGEIFNVRDTMYQGLVGYWQAQRVGANTMMLECGVVPNKARADQQAMVQKIEEQKSTMPRRLSVKRRLSLGNAGKKQKFVSHDHLDECSFADSIQIPAYERVEQKVADFMRPVVILGALGDLVRLKLVEEMPERFGVPTPMELGNGRSQALSYKNAIKISEIRNVIAKDKHCLLDITPDEIEMLTFAQLCPIVILLKSTSRGAVKEMRASLVKELKNSPTGVTIEGDPATAKQVKKMFSNAKRLEEAHSHIFTAKINTHIAGADVRSREFYHELKDIIFSQQKQYVWMPEEKPLVSLDDIVLQAPNYASYLSGADSDTEGESMTSSPVMAKKRYEDEDDEGEEEEEEEFEAPPPPDPVSELELRKHREKSKDGTRSSGNSRDKGEEGEDREKRKLRKSKIKSDVPKSTVPSEVTSSLALESEPTIEESLEIATKHHKEQKEEEEEDEEEEHPLGELEELIHYVDEELVEEVPEHYEIPTKKLTLSERMSKMQPRSSRTPAPRNHINDMRSPGEANNNLYAENITVPSPDFPQITRIERPAKNDDLVMSDGKEEPIVVATARGFFDHRGGLLESGESKVSLFIPYGALPHDDMVEIFFKVCQDSKHMPPLDSESGEETLLSPLVMCGPHGLEFQKPVELRLPHRAPSQDNMTFSLKSSERPVKQCDDLKNLKLEDEEVDGGREYQVSDEYISILLDHF